MLILKVMKVNNSELNFKVTQKSMEIHMCWQNQILQFARVSKRLELSLDSMQLLVRSWRLWFSIYGFPYKINDFFPLVMHGWR